ncbi:MAG: hypothetical protein E7403_04100 [Ruminococcaceae bacterium]|nr:hypothetical protein [Oscillospiraceae bacterium]
MSEKVKNILTVVFVVAIFVGFILSIVFDWGEKCAKCGKGFYKETVYVAGGEKYHNACKPIGHYE